MRIKNINELGKLIKERRKKQNITQANLAAMCGFGVRFVAELERGKETCQIGKALEVLNMLGIILESKEDE